MKKLLALVGVLGFTLYAGRSLLNSEVDEAADEIDLGVVAARRTYQLHAQPLIGITMLSIASDVKLDLRHTTPSPTGIEINLFVLASRVTVLVPRHWRVTNFLASSEVDEPTVRIKGTAYLGAVEVR